MIKKLSISGFRGFNEEQSICFAIPDNDNEGSGLTIVVGSNNSGKTTIGESLRYANPNSEDIHIPKERRNAGTNHRIKIVFEYQNGATYGIQTVENGGSRVELLNTETRATDNQNPYIVPSRRAISFEFGGSYHADENSRNNYMINSHMNYSSRANELNGFDSRILKWANEKIEFDDILTKLLGEGVEWTIDTNSNGNHYISFSNGEHTLEGVGDGIWSIFTLADALYDSQPGSMIVVDEPELSIHPSAQKRIMRTLLEYSVDRQIVITTHSPYFIDWMAIKNGGKLARVIKSELGSKIYQLDNNTIQNNESFFSNQNPHTFGIDSKETFFLHDGVILVEGQEDIVCMRKIISKIGKNHENYDFYGWGVSGSGNMGLIAKILNDLGYRKIVMILDGDSETLSKKEEYEQEFSGYKILNIPKDDIRDKIKYKPTRGEEVKIENVIGVCDERFRIKDNFDEEFKDSFISMFNAIDQYLSIDNVV